MGAVLSQYRRLADIFDGDPLKPAYGRKRQVHGDSCYEVPLGFYSKTLSAVDSRKSQPVLECMAVLLACQHFRPFIWGRKTTVITDASALQWLMTLGEGNTFLLRLALRLQEYDLVIQHRAGASHGNADGLSRNPQHSDQPQQPTATESWPDAMPVVTDVEPSIVFTDTAELPPRTPFATISALRGADVLGV